LEALAEMHSTFVVSKPDRNYGYPWWHYFEVAAVQAGYVGYLKASRGLASSKPEYPFGFSDPVSALPVLAIVGRNVSVAMGAGIVVVAYLFAATLWGHRTGILTALLTMVSHLMIYYSRTGNPDVPMTFWCAAGLLVFARIFTQGITARRVMLLGAFA